MSLFGSLNPPKPATGGLFGSSTTMQSQPQQQSTSLFGSLNTQQAQQAQPQQQQQQQQGSSLFGASSLFGNTSQPQQQGQQQPQQQQQQQQQGGGLFGSTVGASTLPPLQSSLGASQQQQGQQQQQLGQSRLGLSTFLQSTARPAADQKPIPDQIDLLARKWLPQLQSRDLTFQAYFYNQVPAAAAPHYGPGPLDDPAKWDEALAQKPSELSMPALARGFQDLAARLYTQSKFADAMRVRLHEINESLALCLQKHDLEFTVKTAAARRRNRELEQRTLRLARKVQVLRNRGYAMDADEEELRRKLVALDKAAFDPVLSGRQEEIWARLGAVRQRAELLKEEAERTGKNLGANGGEEALGEEEMKAVKKLLGDYDAQLAHLKKELETIKNDFDEWEGVVKPAVSGNGR